MAEAVEDGSGGLGSDLGNARDVVGRVAFEGFDLGDEFGAESVVAVADAFDVVDPGVAEAGVHEEVDLVVDELELVGVAGEDEGADACVLGFADDGSDDVVGLEAVDCEDRDLHGGENALDHGDLFVEFGVDRRSLGLVFVEEFVAEGGSSRVEGYGDVGWAVFADGCDEVSEESVGAVGLLSGAVGQAAATRESEPCSEDHGVAVDDEDEGFSVFGLGCHGWVGCEGNV